MVVYIDNGHGYNTPGKCSPDKTLREWSWNREVAKLVVDMLRELGIDTRFTCPEDNDVLLRERVKRINEACRLKGSKNVVSVSIHINAAGGDGKWHAARGWSVFVSPNASSKSKRLAEMLYDCAKAHGLKTRRPSPTENYWTKSLAMCRDTSCPAVLTENLFMDNEDDAAWLKTEEGKKTIAAIHVEAITQYIEAYK